MSILKTTLIFQFYFFALKNAYSYTPPNPPPLKKKKENIREGLLLRASPNLINLRVVGSPRVCPAQKLG
jgi:hypothetical protein